MSADRGSLPSDPVPCQHCGAEIFFGRTRRNRKLMPLDVEVVSSCDVPPTQWWLFSPDELACWREEHRPGTLVVDHEVYVPHFATCPETNPQPGADFAPVLRRRWVENMNQMARRD